MVHGLGCLAARNDNRLAIRGACKRMRGTPRIGDRGMGSETSAAEAIDKTREHKLLATLKVIGALGVHDDAIRRIHGDDGGVLRQGPERQPF
jgi:hypothetical protein